VEAAHGALPELATVPWRRPASEETLRRRGQLWTLTTVGHVVPFVAVAVVLMLLQPLSAPVALVALAHAWIIPELYAVRGANTVRPKRREPPPSEPVAQGFLGDLLGHRERELQRDTGLALERGRLGTWLVGEAGALLVAPGGRRVHCFCVHAIDDSLPSGDRIAHLLLALRADEEGFATVANLAFSGARWRVRRRMPAYMRPALDVARSFTIR
jgi:hypothetical protein